MARAWLVLLGVVAACGRIDFARRAGDATHADGGADTVPPDAARGFSHLVAYADQTCALFGGAAYCWGANGAGQLGIGTTSDAPAPARVLLPAGTVDDLTQGETVGCAIVDGTLYCAGQLAASATPVAVAVPSMPAGRRPFAVSAGRDFACVLASTVYCWGTNAVGQLGTGDTTSYGTPTPVMGSAAYAALDAGDDHACALDASLAAACWGHNDDGTLGPGVTSASSDAPVLLTNIKTLPSIAGWHACALDTSGGVLCWGEGDHGELGDGTNQNSATARQVVGLAGVTAVTTGGGPTDLDASCAIAGGEVWCWGNGFYGRLGQGSANPASTPVHVSALPGPAVEVAIGYDHACATLADGNVWCWGRGDHGQLGDGAMASSLVPVEVLRPAAGG